MKQRLGPKKVLAIERYTGKKVVVAWTRGGWEHGKAKVVFEGQDGEEWVDYHDAMRSKSCV